VQRPVRSATRKPVPITCRVSTSAQ
jgi:hypothetical protein